mmetsp:Transcript_20266/g.47502  ORF Transcript_20266/g.47502 Transcript_20266/m.47502 type:complete len:286 (+) Transcript_20266:134-991(+)
MDASLQIRSSAWAQNGRSSPRLINLVLRTLILLLTLPGLCRSENAFTRSKIVYRESESQSQSQSQSPPSGCHRSIRPSYFLENTFDAHRLVVNIPENLPRKNTKIDVDYENGEIELFGWWMQRKIRGEVPTKLCVHHRWAVDPEFLSEEAMLSEDLVSIFDMVMSLQDRQLVLSLPVSACADLASPVAPPPPSPILSNNGNEKFYDDASSTENHLSIVIAYGTTFWKKLRGLSRLKNLSRHYANLPWDGDIGAGPQSSMEYLRSRHDALEHFLTQSMGGIGDEFY